jgi:hypothetical protein
VSLVKKTSLARFTKEKNEDIQIYGVTGNQVEIKGQVTLKIENTLEPGLQLCYIVDSLPRNLDIIFGQDWLEKAGYDFRKKTPDIIPPYSERVVKCRTTERGVRFIDHQVLQPGLICAASLVNCEAAEFPCLVINLSDKPLVMTADPKLEKPPTMIHKREAFIQTNKMKRLQLLHENLRLSHITEGTDDIRKICEEYIDIFKLPGDPLTATTAVEHTIPNPASQRDGRSL